jgi:tetratricopeptide (TPR) repeat protein
MPRISYIFCFYILFLFNPIIAFSQANVATGNIKTAKDDFTLGDYKGALDEYLVLIKGDSNNTAYNLRVGLCYVNMDIDKSKAIYYLEKATADPKVDNIAWYELGHAYMVNYQMDKAIKCFNKYKQLTNGKENFVISADRMIQMCEEAKNKIAHPVNVTIENLGTEVNSPYPDFNAYVPFDESFIVFTSKRLGNTGNLMDYDGYPTSDVYISYQKYDKWTKAKGIGNTINTDLVEEAVGLTSNGNKLLIYEDNYNALSQVLVSDRKGKSYQRPESLGSKLNAGKIVTSATISPDNKTLVFASDKNEADGGMDLYISHKLPSGEWGPCVNMGTPINTVYNEDFPSFGSDGKTLYFSSQGHNSMGGYDIFKSVYDEKTDTWSEPENLGYPVNTPDDDFTISLSANGRHGYISSHRKDSYGDRDIYKVTFNDVEPAKTIIAGTLVGTDSLSIFKTRENFASSDSLHAGHVKSSEKESNGPKDLMVLSKDIKDKKDTSTLPKKEINVSITAIDKSTKKVYGRYSPDKRTGKYLIVLPPGDFDINVRADGYEQASETVKIFDRALNSEITKDIVLYPFIHAQDKKTE